jgi:hypothetical protein
MDITNSHIEKYISNYKLITESVKDHINLMSNHERVIIPNLVAKIALKHSLDIEFVYKVVVEFVNFLPKEIAVIYRGRGGGLFKGGKKTACPILKQKFINSLEEKIKIKERQLNEKT